MVFRGLAIIILNICLVSAYSQPGALPLNRLEYAKYNTGQGDGYVIATKETSGVPEYLPLDSLLSIDSMYLDQYGDSTFLEIKYLPISVDSLVRIEVVIDSFFTIPGSDNQEVTLDTITNLLTLERGGSVELSRYLNSNAQCSNIQVSGSSVTSPIPISSDNAKRRVYIGPLLAIESNNRTHPIHITIINQDIQFYEAINSIVTVCSE